MPLRITEATLGSRRTAADTDGDGLSDRAEAMALPFHGTNPQDADSDDDGLSDGADPNPAYRMADRVGKGIFGPASYWLTVSSGSPSLSVRINVGVPDLFRQIDDDGQFSEFFDTDPAFTKPYNGRRIIDDPADGLGFPGRLVTEADLRYTRGGSGETSVWEVAIPWSDATLLRGVPGKRMAIDVEVAGDRLFETDHQARIELTP